MQKEIIEKTTFSQNSEEVHNDKIEKEKSVIRSYNLVWFIVGVIEALLLFRFIFELLAANQYNGFVQLIYTLSYPLILPFHDIFRITYVSYSILDWSIIVAMVVYLIIGYGIDQFLRIIIPTTPELGNKIRPL